MAIDVTTRRDRRTVFVDTFTDGTLGPEQPMLGPVARTAATSS